MSVTSSSRLNAGAHPQSLLALESSNLTGQLSAVKAGDQMMDRWTDGRMDRETDRLTNALTDHIRFVGDLEVRQVLADFLGHLFGREAHGCNVVGSQGQPVFWRLHELHRGAVAIGDVHHGEARFGAQVTLVVARAESIMENLNRIICRDKGRKCSH